MDDKQQTAALDAAPNRFDEVPPDVIEIMEAWRRYVAEHAGEPGLPERGTVYSLVRTGNLPAWKRGGISSIYVRYADMVAALRWQRVPRS